MSRKQDRTGRLLLGRRAAMAAFAALFYITGCTRQTYDSIRLCETTAEQLPALMGGKSQEIRNWRVVSEGTLLLLHHGTVAALTDVRGHILAKVMTEKSTMHWLLFATDSWEERAELRLSTNELEQLKQDFARLQRPIPTSSPQSQPTSTQPTGGLLFDLSGQPSTLAELLTAPISLCGRLGKTTAQAESTPPQSTSVEQIPLVLMVNALLCSPTGAPASNEEEAVPAFFYSVLRFAWLARSLDEDLNNLMTEAEARKLQSSPAPMAITAGNWQVSKRSQDDYELVFRQADVLPPWGRLFEKHPTRNRVPTTQRAETKPAASAPTKTSGVR